MPKPNLTFGYSGASGMIGSALSDRLQNHPTITGLKLSRKSQPYCPDISSASSQDWADVLDGINTYVHLAASLPFDNTSKPDFERDNCHGACMAMDGFAAIGGKHFIFISTIGVNGIINQIDPFRSSDKPNPIGPYAKSKLNAETALRERANINGVKLTIIRPPLVYGLGVGGKFKTLMTHIRQEKPLPLGGINNSRDMIGARNLADIIIALSLSPPQTELPLLVCDRAPVSTPQLVEAIADAFNVKPDLRTIPMGVLNFAANTPFIASRVRRMIGNVRIDDSVLQEHSDWRPEFTLADELTLIAKQECPKN